MKRGARLPEDDGRAIEEAFEAVCANLRAAASVFAAGDRWAAKILSQQKAEFRRREAEAMRTHFARLRESEGSGPRVAPRDRLREIKRVNDHLVAGAAYPVLEAAAELMPSRIAGDDA